MTGWVRNPGVYEFEAGDRVVDAVNRAGGAREGADLSSFNLAAPLADGTQVIVAKEGTARPHVDRRGWDRIRTSGGRRPRQHQHRE